MLTARTPSVNVQQQKRDISACGSENYQGEEYDFSNSNRVTHKQELILLQSRGVLRALNNKYNIKGQISPNRFNGGKNISARKKNSQASNNKNSVSSINQYDRKILKQALQPSNISQSVFGQYKNSMQNLQTSSKILNHDLYMANASQNYKKYRNNQSNQLSQLTSQDSNSSVKKQISSTYGKGIGETGLTQSIRDKNFESQSIDINQEPGSSTKTYVVTKRLNTLKLSTLSTPDPEMRKQMNTNVPINEKKLLYNPQNQFQSKKMSIQNQQLKKIQIGQTVDDMDTNFDPIDQYGSQVRNILEPLNNDRESMNKDRQKQKEIREFDLTNTLKGAPKTFAIQNQKSLPQNLLHNYNNTHQIQKKLINDKHFQSSQQKKVEKEPLKVIYKNKINSQPLQLQVSNLQKTPTLNKKQLVTLNSAKNSQPQQILISSKINEMQQKKIIYRNSQQDLKKLNEKVLQQPLIRPGSSLGGGIQLNKLQKLQRKEQDDIDDLDDVPDDISPSENEGINNNPNNVENSDDSKIQNSNQFLYQFKSL